MFSVHYIATRNPQHPHSHKDIRLFEKPGKLFAIRAQEEPICRILPIKFTTMISHTIPTESPKKKLRHSSYTNRNVLNPDREVWDYFQVRSNRV